MIVWKSHKFILFFFIFFFNPKTSFSPRHPMIFLLREWKSAVCVCVCVHVYILHFFKSDLSGCCGIFYYYIFLSFHLLIVAVLHVLVKIYKQHFFRKESTWEENHKKSNLILLIYCLHPVWCDDDDETKTGMYGKLYIFWCSLVFYFIFLSFISDDRAITIFFSSL